MQILILHIVSCAIMTGLIWVIQILHYPAFNFISENQFQKFHSFHSKNISFIVVPLMIFELTTAVALNLLYSSHIVFWLNTALVFFIWLCTFFLSVPLHAQLEKTKNTQAICRLVLSNWARTALWSLRLFILLYFLFKIIDKSPWAL